MAKVVFTIPDNLINRVIDGVAYVNGYKDMVDDEPNPESKNQFARRMIREYVKRCVVSHESRQAGQKALGIAQRNAEQEIIITDG